MIPTYASFRETPPSSGFSLTAIPGTAANIPRNFRVYFVNRAGRSKMSVVKSITSSGVRLTLNNTYIHQGDDLDFIQDGEEVFWIGITCEITGLETDAVTIAQWQARDLTQQNQRSLPVDIEFVIDDHFNLTRTVTKSGATLVDSDFPTTDILAGAISYSPDNNIYYRYDPEAYVDADNNLRSYGAYVQQGFSNGWVKYEGTNLAYIASTTDLYGSDRRVDNVENPLNTPPKIGNNPSTFVRYWLNNGYQDDGQSSLVDPVFELKVSIDGQPGYETTFSTQIEYYLRGYVNRASGIIDTNVDDLDARKVYVVDSPATLTTDLPRNYAAVLDLTFTFDNDFLEGKLKDEFFSIDVDFAEVLGVQGITSSIPEVTGAIIMPSLNQLLIVPGLTRLSGVAFIDTGGEEGFVVRKKNEQPIVVQVSDTPNQQVALGGSTNGLTQIRQQNEALQYSEVLRAVISTETGITTLVDSGAPIAIAASGFSVTVTHPVNGDGFGIIRADYFDTYLAGNEKGRFTPTKGAVFVNLDGQIYQSLQNITVTQIQVFTFVDLTGFTAIADHPVQTDPEFSLFHPVSVTVAADITGTVTGNMIVSFGYIYESPNLIATKINHSATGTIPTLNKTLAEAINDTLSRAENLNDLPDKAIARENLDVYPKSELDNTNLLVASLEQATATLTATLTATQTVVSQMIPKVNLTRELITLPKVLAAVDHGKNLVLTTVQTGQITIPDDISSFPDDYFVVVNMEIAGQAVFDREDGLQTGLFYSGGNRYLKSVGSVVIRRGDTNKFYIEGQLEDL